MPSIGDNRRDIKCNGDRARRGTRSRSLLGQPRCTRALVGGRRQAACHERGDEGVGLGGPSSAYCVLTNREIAKQRGISDATSIRKHAWETDLTASAQESVRTELVRS